MAKKLTGPEAADILGVKVDRIYSLLRAGKITGTKLARDWRIDARSVAAYAASPRKAGRPRK